MMMSIYVADVGSGLCISLRTISGKRVQIDCGDDRDDIKAFIKFRVLNHVLPNVFILSHFHCDHYNGLLQAMNKPMVFFGWIRDVYYPTIPDFPEIRDEAIEIGIEDIRSEFMCDIMAINARVFGSETGIMEYDFLKSIYELNHGKDFNYRSLAKGDVININGNINGSVFEVLWPPRVISPNVGGHEKISKTVIDAIKAFRKALDEDEELRRIYEKIKKNKTFLELLTKEKEGVYNKEIATRSRCDRLTIDIDKRELPKSVQDANTKLRDAANYLSLVFYEDNRLLFMGDAKEQVIRNVVRDLVESKGRSHFYVLIAPHHGTYWDNSLRRLHSIYTVISVGNCKNKLHQKVRPEFKEISEMVLTTYLNGDIRIPFCPFYPHCPIWDLKLL